jgi:hypothetical protein
MTQLGQSRTSKGSNRTARLPRMSVLSRRRALILAGAISLTIVVLAIGWAASLRGGGGEAPRSIATIHTPDVHALVIDPTNRDHVFFGGHAGLQESADGGRTWRAGPLRGADAMIITASRTDPATFYVAGHDVFDVSLDGKRWRPITSGLPGTDIHAFAQDPLDPTQLFAFVAGQGIVRSTDGGVSWGPLAAQPGGGDPIALADNGATLYAVTPTGIEISPDRGGTWTSLRAQPDAVISVAATAANSALIYAGAANGLFKSTDGGRSWVQIARTKGIVAIALSADAARVLFVTDQGAVFRSDDGGATWLIPT